MKKCPNCGATLQDDDNYCVYCGKSVQEETVFESTVNEDVCEYCHKPMKKEDQFCPSCGMERRKEQDGHPHDSNKSGFQHYALFWKQAFDFKGRTSRRGYWDVFWINLLIEVILSWICPLIPALNITYEIDNELIINYMQSIYGILDPDELAELLTYSFNIITDVVWPLLIFIPSLSIAIRRLRDVGKQWYAIFINLIPLWIGNIIYIVWLLKPSDYFKYNRK